MLSVLAIFVYTNKSVTSYVRTESERVPNSDPNSYLIKDVERTHFENYSASGAAIGFGIIAGSALLAIALTDNRKVDEDKHL